MEKSGSALHPSSAETDNRMPSSPNAKISQAELFEVSRLGSSDIWVDQQVLGYKSSPPRWNRIAVLNRARFLNPQALRFIFCI